MVDQHPFDTETFEQRRARIIAQADELEWQWRRGLAERQEAGELDTEPRRLSLVESTPTRSYKRPPRRTFRERLVQAWRAFMRSA